MFLDLKITQKKQKMEVLYIFIIVVLIFKKLNLFRVKQIYIKNENALNNKGSFDNLYFNEIKAVYGGAVYIYSSNKEGQVSFSKCTFKSNQATKQDSKDDPLSGGSSIYINVKTCTIKRCKFSGGLHGRSSLKIAHIFEGDETEKSVKMISSSQFDKNDNERKILVTYSIFEQNKESLSSIYYLGGKNNEIVQIKNCGFKGKLSTKSHYIDGSLLKKNND